MNKGNIQSEFRLSSWSIKNHMTVLMIIVIIIVGGLYSYLSMPREAFPEVVESKIYISTVYPGNSAEDVEKFITQPLEDEIKDVSGVVEITSNTLQGYSLIVIEFDDEIPIEEAKSKISDKVDLSKGKADWPSIDSGPKVDPYVFNLDFAELFPIMFINLTGNFSPDEINEYGEILERKIEAISEINDVKLLGVQEKEVEIAVDLIKMTASNVSINNIIQAVQNENVTISGGNIITNGLRRNVRVIGQISNPDDLGNVIVKKSNGVVYLKDIAKINFREKDRTTYSRLFSKPVVMLSVTKKGGKNALNAAKKIRDLIGKLHEKELPKHLNINITNDNTSKTKDQVSELENSIFLGVILVTGVLMFFLGFRNALFVGIAIPLSMLLSFILVYSMGLTLNTMVLFAMVMGLGMLVDNGIVVVENVFRLMKEGMSRVKAAKQGVGEIAWPIIASTATTLSAFVPLGLWPGTMGKFMIYFPLTLATVLGSSLFVALVVNAMLTSRFMKIDIIQFKKNNRWSFTLLILGLLAVTFGLFDIDFVFDIEIYKALGGFCIIVTFLMWLNRVYLHPFSLVFQNNFLPWLENKYKTFLRFALQGKNPLLCLFGTFFLLVFSLLLFIVVKPPILFFPENQPNQILVYIEYPEGIDIEKTKMLTQKIEDKVIQVVKKYEVIEDDIPYNFMVESIISQVGEGAGNPMTEGGSQNEMPNKGKVTISMREFKYRRGKKSSELLELIKNSVKDYPGAIVLVEKDQVGPPAGYPINIEVQGEDYFELYKVASDMRKHINTANILGIEELLFNVSINKPELEVYVDRRKAGKLGVSTRDVGFALRQAIYGIDVSTFKDEKDFDIYVRFNKNDRFNIENLINQPITFRDQDSGKLISVPISSLVKTKKTETFSSIRRKNNERIISIYSGVNSGYNSTEVVEKIKSSLSGFRLPSSISYRFTGEQEEQTKNMDFLKKALIIAIAFIMLIIVAQFNSISKPFIILIAVLFSFIGVFLGLVIFQMEFVIIMTMLGIISLGGIVVNNAIVLIDYTQLLTKREKKKRNISEEEKMPLELYNDIIIKAGKARLRPVLLTAITTILGLIPLAIGLNIDFYRLFTKWEPKVYIGGDNNIFWEPMSWTIIFGLSFATFLTLILVPVLLHLIERFKIYLSGKKLYTFMK